MLRSNACKLHLVFKKGKIKKIIIEAVALLRWNHSLTNRVLNFQIWTIFYNFFEDSSMNEHEPRGSCFPQGPEADCLAVWIRVFNGGEGEGEGRIRHQLGRTTTLSL